MKRIIDRVDKLIKERGLTAKQVAIDVGISPGNITDWRKNRAKPTAESVAKLADYFDVSTDYLYGRVNKPYAQLPDELKEVGYEWIKFVKNCKDANLSPEQIQELIEVAEKFKR